MKQSAKEYKLPPFLMTRRLVVPIACLLTVAGASINSLIYIISYCNAAFAFVLFTPWAFIAIPLNALGGIHTYQLGKRIAKAKQKCAGFAHDHYATSSADLWEYHDMDHITVRRIVRYYAKRYPKACHDCARYMDDKGLKRIINRNYKCHMFFERIGEKIHTKSK